MNELHLLWHSYGYFPYEQKLAHREAEALCGGTVTSSSNSLIIAADTSSEQLRRLTYFKGVVGSGPMIIPDQARLEASSLVRRPTNATEDSFPQLRRQSTRYSAHGLHEYRGKFNPQVVRAIGNLMQLGPRACVLDPFCGSGTSLLEGAHMGWSTFGIDLNPLAIMIANAKLAAFNSDQDELAVERDRLVKRINRADLGKDWKANLPEPEYLKRWFPIRVLEQLWVILREIRGVRKAALRDVFRVVLSDICREVSLQDPGDLRIRRRKNPAENYPAIELFIEALNAKVDSVLRAREYVAPTENARQLGLVGDSRAAHIAATLFMRGVNSRGFDAAITSPPYATALPYLDTQRLSLALLGLISSEDLRAGEKILIGNREIQDKVRLDLEAQLRANTGELPSLVISFCSHLLEMADHPSHGFRRRNVPALVYKYLIDMAAMFVSVRTVMKSGSRYALLVGSNTTTLRDQEISIDTPNLLALVAESRGWQVEEMLSFETYQRFDIHQSNSIRAETLLILRAP